MTVRRRSVRELLQGPRVASAIAAMSCHSGSLRRLNDGSVQLGAAAQGLAGAQALETGADDVQRVLGGKQQHGAAGGDGEAAQARHASGDADRHVEREEGLAALRLAADDADGLLGPQPVDEPAARLGQRLELAGAARVEPRHRRPAARRGVWAAAGAAAWQTSR